MIEEVRASKTASFPNTSVVRGDAPFVLRGAGLRKSFGGQRVLDGVDIEIRRGEFILLCGPNGSGKSTLLNVLAGDDEPESGMLDYRLEGRAKSFGFPRRWQEVFNPRDPFSPEGIALMGLSRTWQDIRLFGSQSLRDNIAVSAPSQLGERPWNVLFRPLEVARSERANRLRADQMLADLGLSGREESSGDRISLGQAKRVAIARAVFARAGLLFLDEPMAGLDDEGVEQILASLRCLQQERKVAVVIVEHVLRIPMILPIVDTVWTLDDGKIDVRTISEARKLVSSTSHAEDWRRWSSGFGRPTRQIVLPHGAVLEVYRRDDKLHSDKEVLAVEGLVLRRGSRALLGDDEGDALSFTLHDGDIGVLEAPNGWGKTTLLEAIVGLLRVDTGAIRLRTKDISKLPPWERRARGIAMLQSRRSTFDNLTVAESFSLCGAQSVAPQLNGMMHRVVGSLSGGERQRVAFLCSMAGEPPDVVLLDEPFSMLDRGGIEIVVETIQKYPHGAILVAVPNGVSAAGKKGAAVDQQSQATPSVASGGH